MVLRKAWEGDQFRKYCAHLARDAGGLVRVAAVEVVGCGWIMHIFWIYSLIGLTDRLVMRCKKDMEIQFTEMRNSTKWEGHIADKRGSSEGKAWFWLTPKPNSPSVLRSFYSSTSLSGTYLLAEITIKVWSILASFPSVQQRCVCSCSTVASQPANDTM